MEKTDTVVAVFDEHPAAEAASRQLAGAGFAVKQFSIVGKGYHTDHKGVGFYNTGETPVRGGSWWLAWNTWLDAQSGARILHPPMGAALGDAPGDCVREH